MLPHTAAEAVLCPLSSAIIRCFASCLADRERSDYNLGNGCLAQALNVHADETSPNVIGKQTFSFRRTQNAYHFLNNETEYNDHRLSVPYGFLYRYIHYIARKSFLSILGYDFIKRGGKVFV